MGDFANGDLESLPLEIRAAMHLRDLVFSGRMQPKEAEAKAVEMGLEPLVGRPDKAIYDPMLQASWTPLQAVVWIACRNADDVRDVSSEFRERWTHWRRLTSPLGFEASSVGDASLSSIHNLFDGNAIDRATAELHSALCRGNISARGTVLSNKENEAREDISRERWGELLLCDCDKAIGIITSSNNCCDIKILREDIIDAWPVKRNDIPPRPTVSVAKSKVLAFALKHARPDRSKDETRKLVETDYGRTVPEQVWREVKKQIVGRQRGDTDKTLAARKRSGDHEL